MLDRLQGQRQLWRESASAGQLPEFKPGQSFIDGTCSEVRERVEAGAKVDSAVAVISGSSRHCVSMYGQLFQQTMDQTGMVANPDCGQLNIEHNFFPVPVRA